MAATPLWRRMMGSAGAYLSRHAALPTPATATPPSEVTDVVKQVLTEEIAVPGPTGVRSVLTGYPTDGMTPERMGRILRSADSGDPLAYFEMAEQIEERDLHYLGVLGTRKRSVAKIPIRIEEGGNDALSREIAARITQWLKRDTLKSELFDIMDAVGKGISFTEITWEVSSGQWEPKHLEWRDPRWFRFDLVDGRTPLLITETGVMPLFPGKFIVANIQAKSGLPIRSGIARAACWAWMFKSYTARDWQVFLQAFGQPVRIGKYDTSAKPADIAVLKRAVRNIAGDCAAVIPDTMTIEFVESAGITQSTDAYLARSNWIDQQVSKAVLGQTATTDAIAGGHAVGKEHREVQEDIKDADAGAVAGFLNRDFIRSWVDLEYGPQDVYPRAVMEEPDQQDVEQISNALNLLVPLGLTVKTAEVRTKIGFSDPAPGDDVLKPAPTPPAPTFPKPETSPPLFTEGQLARAIALQLAQGVPDTDAVEDAVSGILDGDGWVPLISPIVAGLQDKLQGATSMDDVRTVLASHLAQMDTGALTDTLSKAGFSARIAGLAGESLSSQG